MLQFKTLNLVWLLKAAKDPQAQQKTD
jgi:hypothetical protein